MDARAWTLLLWLLAAFLDPGKIAHAAERVPTRMLISGKRGCDLRPVHHRHGHRLVKRFTDLEIDVVEIRGDPELSAAVHSYRCSPEVEAVELDHMVRVESAPNDPAYTAGLLWPLRNYGQSGGVSGADLEALTAWDRVSGAAKVVVGVIDTGVRYTHEDLAANIWRNPNEIPGNGYDDDQNGYVDDIHGIDAIAGTGDPMDEQGHGTHVAGIIGAVGNNGKGVVGVAWNVQLLPLKFIAKDGYGAYSDAIECIEYARKAGVTLINVSWGGTNYSTALRKAIDSARAAGIVFVTAAGNLAADCDVAPFYPGSFPLDNIANVAATTRHDLLDTEYSNFGARKVLVAAPGTDIYSTWFTSDEAYDFLSGTSMAAPHVTGVLALMKVRFPAETYRQLITRLAASCTPLPSLQGKCVSEGRVNLRAALNLPARPASHDLARLSILSGGTGPRRYKLSAPATQTYIIEVSQGLEQWTPILTNTIWSDGTAVFSDPTPRYLPQRFFRARLLPSIGAD